MVIFARAFVRAPALCSFDATLSGLLCLQQTLKPTTLLLCMAVICSESVLDKFNLICQICRFSVGDWDVWLHRTGHELGVLLLLLHWFLQYFICDESIASLRSHCNASRAAEVTETSCRRSFISTHVILTEGWRYLPANCSVYGVCCTIWTRSRDVTKSKVIRVIRSPVIIKQYNLQSSCHARDDECNQASLWSDCP